MKRSQSLVRASLCILAAGLTAFGGCGGGEEEATTASAPQSAGNADEAASAPASGAPAPGAAGASGRAAPASPIAQLVRSASAVPRKIIYNATVELVSDNFSAADQKLMQLVRANKGYIAERNISGTAGAPRTGTWKIRIPVDNFDPFMDAIARLGELQTVHSDSQDVSEEFYDLQARISNKQVEEKRLIRHLEKSTAKLSDILTVEQELSRVRGEIEQMQGRLRVLANLTALTTVTVTIREVKDYVPPAPPTFTAQIARTFQGSLGRLSDFGKAVVLLAVALAPWLLVAAIVGFPVWRLTRPQLPRRKTTPPPPPAPLQP